MFGVEIRVNLQRISVACPRPRGRRWTPGVTKRTSIHRPGCSDRPRWSAACTSVGAVPNQESNTMFSLKIVDHVRLDSERVSQNYTVHAAAAERIGRLITVFRIGIVVLLAFAAASEIANVLFPHSVSPAAAIGAGLLALVTFAVYAALGLESRVFAHRTFAHRLWIV